MMLNEISEATRPDSLSPESQATSEAVACAPAPEDANAGSSPAAMPLDALRDAKQLTQVQMAQLLKISQGAVSKVERRTDMFISTLRNYVRAIGGDLEIRAVFPDGDVLIDQFSGKRRPDHSAATRATSRRYERKTAAMI